MKPSSAVLLSGVLLLVLGSAEGAKILAVFSMPSPSHYFLGNAFLKGLAERGHDVTMVSPYKNKEPPTNGTYREIVLAELVEMMEEFKKDVNFFERPQGNKLISKVMFAIMAGTKMGGMAQKVFENEDFQKLLNSGERFDAVIIQQFMNEAQKGLAAHFDAPLILFCNTGLTSWVDEFVGNPAPFSYVPELSVEPEGERMTFWERALNPLMYSITFTLKRLVMYPAQRRLLKKYLPDVPDLEQLQRNVSLALMNGHVSLNPATPHVPSMIDIGGFHVRPSKKLPKDLQEFLDGSPEGVIYLSFGSNLRSADLPVAKREAFLKTFAKLKQKVLWKWEDDTLPGQPPNVKLGKWLPQQDVLAHPNVKLFITHGGFLSITEAVFSGVPVLAIPIFADQQFNANGAVRAGFGLSLHFGDLSEETLTKSFAELLENPKFAETAKEKSRLFHDRPMTPMDTGAYWVEYVIRNNGAPHLRVAGLDLPWYQYYLLDVAALFIAVGLVLLYINYIVSRAVLRAVCRRCSKSATKSGEDAKKKRQ